MQSIFTSEPDESVVTHLDDALVDSRRNTCIADSVRKGTGAQVASATPYMRNGNTEDKLPGICKRAWESFCRSKDGEDNPGVARGADDEASSAGFRGLVGYYRRLAPNFSKTAYPLSRLLRDDSG